MKVLLQRSRWVHCALVWCFLQAAAGAVLGQPAAGDANWMPGFEVLFETKGSNPTRYPNVLAFDDADGMYVGGHFDRLVITNSPNLVRYDGTNWRGVGGGLNGEVRAILIEGTNVFVGGEFTEAGGVLASRVARWDGIRWWPVGDGLDDGAVRTLAYLDGRLYAAGTFTHVAGIPAIGVACWDGTNWSSPGGGLFGNMLFGAPMGNALLTEGDTLYLGGSFTNVGGITAIGIASWDGVEWQAVGEGFTFEAGGFGEVFSMDLDESGRLIAAGGARIVNYPLLKRWDGETWERFFEEPPVSNGIIPAVTTFQGDLYVLDLLTVRPLGGTLGDEIDLGFMGRWSDETGWEPVDVPFFSGMRALVRHRDALYVAGNLDYVTAPYNGTPGIIRHDGEQWTIIGNGLYSSTPGVVQTLVAAPNGVLAGGLFYTGYTTDQYGDMVAHWNGSQWSQLAEGLHVFTSRGSSGAVYSLAMDGDRIFAGGEFVLFNNTCRSVAVFDGTHWAPLGLGVPGACLAIVARGEYVYAGGNFGIRRWTGSEWVTLDTDLEGVVKALAFMGEDLIVGGDFLSAGGSAADYLARWNGEEWIPMGVGEGVDGPVEVLCVAAPDELIVGGEFLHAGGALVNRIARWKDGQWNGLGLGFENGRPTDFLKRPVATSVKALSRHPSGRLFAGGNFQRADGKSANFVAMWDGAGWQPLGSGLSDIVYGLAGIEDGLMVGGDFFYAGGRRSMRFALWRNGAFSDMPRLGVNRAGEMIQVIWPESATDYTLESAVESPASGQWDAMTNDVEVINGRRTMTLPIGAPPRYFRLRE